MGIALTLLAILAAVIVIPILVGRLFGSRQSEIDDYLDEQHGDGNGRHSSWPISGDHMGFGG